MKYLLLENIPCHMSRFMRKLLFACAKTAQISWVFENQI